MLDAPSLPATRARLAAVLRAAKDVVSVDTVARTLTLDRPAAAKLLARWREQGWLRRIGHGLYVPVPLEREVARLIPYAEQYGNGAVFKRLGFLAETRLHDAALAAACRARSTQGYAQLDPDLSCSRLVTAWRLWVPDRWKQEARRTPDLARASSPRCDPAHAHHPDSAPTRPPPVFQQPVKGGTCLKKCYFETYRFSEDLSGTP